jgi:O-acetylhomoserine/O-acetylserine sulfhydrylase-like pyridoxal-dependent enzyme
MYYWTWLILTWHLFTTIYAEVSLDESASLGISGKLIYLLVDLKDGYDLIENLGEALAFPGAR